MFRSGKMAGALIALLSVLQLADSLSIPATEEGLMYLGSSKGGNTRSGRQSLYFASVNNANWQEARLDCEERFDGDSHLVKIETLDELETVFNYVDKHGGAGKGYWTAGMYSKSAEGFTWGGKRSAIKYVDGAIPWDKNYPDQSESSTRIAVSGDEEFLFKTKGSDEQLRYICEFTPSM